jgi:hypothetical protein
MNRILGKVIDASIMAVNRLAAPGGGLLYLRERLMMRVGGTRDERADRTDRRGLGTR